MSREKRVTLKSIREEAKRRSAPRNSRGVTYSEHRRGGLPRNHEGLTFTEWLKKYRPNYRDVD